MNPSQLMQGLLSRGLDLVSAVPDPELGQAIAAAMGQPGLRFAPATSEGDAIALALGSALGSRPAVVMLPAASLGDALNALSSLLLPCGMPALLVVWLPNQPLVGRHGDLTYTLLQMMGVAYLKVGQSGAELDQALDTARDHLSERRAPFVLLIDPTQMEPAQPVLALPPRLSWSVEAAQLPHPRAAAAGVAHHELVAAVASSLRPDDIVVASGGAVGDCLMRRGGGWPAFYLCSSMGRTACVGLGLALARPERRVIVLDGDGPSLMRLSAMATVAQSAPRRLLHLVLDDGRLSAAVAATVGQRPGAQALADMAAVCGYAHVYRRLGLGTLAQRVREPLDTLTFAHLKVRRDTLEARRLRVDPFEVATRVHAHLSPADQSARLTA